MGDLSYDPVTKIISRPSNPDAIDGWTLGEFFWKHMKEHSSKVAQIIAATGEKDLYSDYLLRAIRTAIEMRQMGVQAGDIITICSHNHLNNTVPYIAAHLIGAITASTDPTISKTDNEYLMNVVKPKVIFVNEAYEDTMGEIAANLGYDPTIVVFGASKNGFRSFEEFLTEKEDEQEFEPVKDLDPNSDAVIYFSSGTTGNPKGIAVSHNFMVYNMSSLDVFQGSNSVLGYASLYWISTNMFMLRAIYQGSVRLVCYSFDAHEFWTYITQYKLEMVFLAPTQAIRCIKVAPMTIRTKLKVLLIGGSPISPTYLQKVRDYLPHTLVTVGYGQTEVWVSSFYTREHMKFLHKMESSGFPVSGYTIKFVDISTEEAVGFNTPGEIRVKAKYLMNGYYNQDSSDCWDAEGFFKSGDVGYYDEDFCFYITDRIKEMFKYMSWHIIPAKLEAVLESHPDVALAAVVGIPHDEDDNHAMGIVVLNKGARASAEAIEKFVGERVDERNQLRGGVRFVDAMPYTPTGKIKRRELRDMVVKGLL